MKLEHVALNVADPRAMAAWYRDHLGQEFAMELAEPPYTHFLRDSGGRMMLEIYNNPADAVPDYASMDPLLLHVAFVSDDPDADAEKLVAAGATLVGINTIPDGSRLAMLRDPCGLAIQLCKRSKSMFVTAD